MDICSEITFEEAKSSYKDYEYALIYSLSKVYFGKVKDSDNYIEIDWDECIEARFFSEAAELNMYRDDEDEEIKAVVIKDNKDACYDVVIKKYDIATKFKNAGVKIKVKEYISYDEDGQAIVAHKRLAGVEGGNVNGDK